MGNNKPERPSVTPGEAKPPKDVKEAPKPKAYKAPHKPGAKSKVLALHELNGLANKGALKRRADVK